MKEAKIEQFPIGKINIDKEQPRKTFKNVKELADDISIHGLLHNIALNGGNKIIYGERRYRACKLLGWKTIPAKIYPNELTILERIELQLTENSSREDLPVIEKARTYERFCKAYATDKESLTVKSKYTTIDLGLNKLAKIENCSITQIREILSLLKSPIPIQEALNEGVVRLSHIVEAMKIKDEQSKKTVLDRIMKESSELTTEVKRINKEYDVEIERITKEKVEAEKKAKEEAKKRQDDLRRLEILKAKAKKEEKKRIEEEKKRKIKEAKEAKERERKEKIRREKEVTLAKKKKQEAEKKAKEKKEIIQSNLATRDISRITNNPKISDTVKEAVAKGIIKAEQVTADFENLDEDEQRQQLAEMVKAVLAASADGTKKRIELEAFLKKNKELLKVPKEVNDEELAEFKERIDKIEFQLPNICNEIIYLKQEEIDKWLTDSRKKRLLNSIMGLVNDDLLKLMNMLDEEYKYSLEKEEK